jgi:hypothetical protein
MGEQLPPSDSPKPAEGTPSGATGEFTLSFLPADAPPPPFALDVPLPRPPDLLTRPSVDPERVRQLVCQSGTCALCGGTTRLEPYGGDPGISAGPGGSRYVCGNPQCPGAYK